MNDFNEYCCPKCGWEPPDFNGTFYRIVKGEVKLDLSHWDLEETGLPQPPEYYPKFGNKWPSNHPDFHGVEWEETHFCPHCKKEFSFINSSI